MRSLSVYCRISPPNKKWNFKSGTASIVEAEGDIEVADGPLVIKYKQLNKIKRELGVLGAMSKDVLSEMLHVTNVVSKFDGESDLKVHDYPVSVLLAVYSSFGAIVGEGLSRFLVLEFPMLSSIEDYRFIDESYGAIGEGDLGEKLRMIMDRIFNEFWVDRFDCNCHRDLSLADFVGVGLMNEISQLETELVRRNDDVVRAAYLWIRKWIREDVAD